MSVITDTWRGLVQRRLWPIAVLLLAAVAAVPVLLASKSEPAAPPPAAATASESTDLAAKPIVALASAEDRESGRRLLGSRKNPFGTAADAKAAQAKDDAAKEETTTTGDEQAAGGSEGSAPSGGSEAPGGTPATDGEPKKTYELNELTVRWGDSSAESLTAQPLKRLKALPSNDEPVAIYLGVLEDGETAVFLVDSTALAQGDGNCYPSPTNCQTIHLREGETEFFDVTDEAGGVVQYQLDVVKIRSKKKTATASAAQHDLKATAPGGRKALRARMSRAGRYRFDSSTGRLRRLSAKAYKAAAARASRR